MALAFTIYSARTSGVKVEILLYAFIVDYVLRLWTIRLVYLEMRSVESSWIGAIAPLISRPPLKYERSQPVREGENGPPARLGVYFVVIVVLAMFAFVLGNVGADKQLHVTPADTLDAVSWALAIGAVYWANSLLNRAIVIDPRMPFTHNLGYNTKEITVFALAVLTAALVVAVRQNMDLGPSAWTVMGPLIGFRFLYDLWSSLDALGEVRQNTAP